MSPDTGGKPLEGLPARLQESHFHPSATGDTSRPHDSTTLRTQAGDYESSQLADVTLFAQRTSSHFDYNQMAFDDCNFDFNFDFDWSDLGWLDELDDLMR